MPHITLEVARRYSCVALALTVTVLTACGGGGGGTRNPAFVVSISLSPQAPSVAAGLTQQFTATGSFSDGTTQALSSANWSTSDATLATVNSTGLVSTLKQGSVTISASVGTVTGNATLAIGPAQPVGITIPSSSILINSTAKVSALLTFTDKSTIDISDQVAWNLANPYVATLSGRTVTPLRTGYTTLSATNGTFSGTGDVTVLAIPRYLYLISDAGRAISRATIDNSTGQFRYEGYQQTNGSVTGFPACMTIDPFNHYLYSSGFGSAGPQPTGLIQIFSMDQISGKLTEIAGSPFSDAGPLGACIEFEPSGKYAYATDGVNNIGKLLSFSRDANTGALTLLNTIPFASGASQLAMDPLGKYLYVATLAVNSSAQAYGYNINNSTGALTPIPGTPFPLPNVTGSFSFHPSGNFVYMSNSGGSTIDSYLIDRSTGQLSGKTSVNTCVNPSVLHFSPNAKFAYATCASSLASFAVGVDGKLSPLGTTSIQGPSFDLDVDPSGRFLYATTNANYIYVFQVGADGNATFFRKIGGRPNQASIAILGGASPVTYKPKFAYISSVGDNRLTAYAVNQDASLTSLQSTPTVTAPFSMSLLPWGSDLLLASPSAATVAFMIDPLTGMPGSPVNFGVVFSSIGGVAIDPSGVSAIEADSANAVMRTYTRVAAGSWGLNNYIIDPVNNIIQNTFPAGSGAGPIAIDPAGRFAYVGNQAANTISGYQYFGSPELQEAKAQFTSPYPDSSPYAIGAKPLALAADPTGALLYVICDDQTVRVYTIDYTKWGHIALASTTNLPGLPAALAAEPTGRYLYVADSTGVTAFSVNLQSGALTPVQLSSPVALANVNGLYVEPSGKTLYVTTSTTGSGAVYAYKIADTGSLTSASGGPVATPNQPSSMAFTADIH